MEQGLRLTEQRLCHRARSELPFDAATLVRVSQQFPGQSVRQVRAFVLESAPSSEPGVNGRFDRLQAARLTWAPSFGYFISQVFRGQEALGGDERVLSPAEARAVQELIQRSRILMRSRPRGPPRAAARGRLRSRRFRRRRRDDLALQAVKSSCASSRRVCRSSRAHSRMNSSSRRQIAEQMMIMKGCGPSAETPCHLRRNYPVTDDDVSPRCRRQTLCASTRRALQAVLAEGCLWLAYMGRRARCARTAGELGDRAGDDLPRSSLSPPERTRVE